MSTKVYGLRNRADWGDDEFLYVGEDKNAAKALLKQIDGGAREEWDLVELYTADNLLWKVEGNEYDPYDTWVYPVLGTAKPTAKARRNKDGHLEAVNSDRKEAIRQVTEAVAAATKVLEAQRAKADQVCACCGKEK